MNLPTFAIAMAMGTLAWAGGPSTTPNRNVTPAKKPAAATAVHRTTARSTAARGPVHTVASTAARHTAKKAPVVHTSWRTRQSSPTADRYREIQEALVARGYLSQDDATGAWGSASSDALKRFQVEQTLNSTGRIDSLSLIALGLGPRHDSSESVQRAVEAATAQAELGRNN
ncbi:MAG TPA: peptidoglycan-binding domain-containing protein [Bryobacteraceae bacterium]|nr:peptidoglycan-binding domain-containing protein [Bryobacteraceae bacterium]